MTKNEAAVRLAEHLLNEHEALVECEDIDGLAFLEAYRNAPPAKAVEVVVTAPACWVGGSDYNMNLRADNKQSLTHLKGGTRLRITVIDPVDLTDGHPMPGGTL